MIHACKCRKGIREGGGKIFLNNSIVGDISNKITDNNGGIVYLHISSIWV